MILDAREFEHSSDLFRKLKELLAMQCGGEVLVEVVLNTYDVAKKVKAFASMSGCNTSIDIDKEKDYYVVRITGTPCCAA